MGPKMAQAFIRGGVNDLRRMLIKTEAIFGLLLVIFCVVMIPFGGRVVMLIYGGKFVGTETVVSILVLGIFVSELSAPVAKAFWAIERADINFKIGLIALGLTCTLGLWLTKVLGLVGVAYGYLAISVTTATLRWIIIARIGLFVHR